MTEQQPLSAQGLAQLNREYNLKEIFFCLGGAEAHGNAMKMARLSTGRHKILARCRSYHGATHGAIAVTGDYPRQPAEPARPGESRPN